VIATGASPASTAAGPIDEPGGATAATSWWAVAAVAILSFSFRFQTVGEGLDPSWHVGIGWLQRSGLDYGTDALFTYGPLGLLAVPTLASSSSWIVLALLVSIAVAWWFARVVLIAVSFAERRWSALAIALFLGVLVGRKVGLTDTVVLTLVLDVHSRLPGRGTAPLTLRRAAGYGALIAATSMCKLTASLITSVAVGVLIVAWPGKASRRATAIGAVGGGAAVTGLGLWFLAGGSVEGLPVWLRGCAEIVSAYSTSMVLPLAGRWAAVELILMAALMALLVGMLVALPRRPEIPRWPEIVLMGCTAWFLLKSGLVRISPGHLSLPLLGLPLLIAALAAPLRQVRVVMAAFALSVVGLIADPETGSLTEVRELTSEWSDQPGRVWDAVAVGVSSSERVRQREEAQQQIQDLYAEEGLTRELVAALDGRRVHAEPWDVAALWAYGLDWQPLPVIQTYSAYGPHLDHRNAELVRDPSRGPDAVLLTTSSVDYRVPEWESPEARFEMACHFETVDEAGRWSVLHRRANVCGRPVEIGRVRAAPGQAIDVPEGAESELIAATFDIEPSMWKRTIDLIARDPRVPYVRLNGARARFVPETAPGMHLVVLPDRLRDTDLPGRAVDIRSIAFENLGGPVVVTFYAVPLT